jgi:hypothetical protein
LEAELACLRAELAWKRGLLAGGRGSPSSLGNGNGRESRFVIALRGFAASP